jgi:hypothetical protein
MSGRTTIATAGTSTKLLCDALGKLQVDVIGGVGGDATAANQALQLAQAEANAISVNNIDTKITSGADTTLAAAQQVLCYGEVTSGPGTGELHPIHITNAGDVEVEIADFVKGQDIMAASFPVVIASDQSTLNVAGTVAVSGVTGTVAVSATALPLPSGAATENTLNALNLKVTACDTGSIAGTVAVSSLPSITGTVAVSSVGGTVAVSATALPLPSGASTETTLSALNTKVTKGNDATLIEAQQVGSYAVNESSGLFQPLSAHHSNKSLKTTDANITKGEDIIVGGSGGIQQVLMYGKTATGGNNLQPVELTGDRLIVDVQELNVGFTQNTGGSMTQAGAVQIYGGYDDGLGGARKMRTLKTDDNGVLDVSNSSAATETTLSAINGKIERGTALSSGNTNLQAQRVQIMGGYDAGGLHREMRTLKTDDSGRLVIRPSYDNKEPLGSNTFVIPYNPAGTTDTFTWGYGPAIDTQGHSNSMFYGKFTPSPALTLTGTPLNRDERLWIEQGVSATGPWFPGRYYTLADDNDGPEYSFRVNASLQNRYVRFAKQNWQPTDDETVELYWSLVG